MNATPHHKPHREFTVSHARPEDALHPVALSSVARLLAFARPPSPEAALEPSTFGPLVPDPLLREGWNHKGTPVAPWAPGLASLDLSAAEHEDLYTRCEAWLAKLYSPAAQLDLWSRIVVHQPGNPVSEMISTQILSEWLLFDAPWPGERPPLQRLSELAAADGQSAVAAGLWALAEARLEVFVVVGHHADGRIAVRQHRPGKAWREILTVRLSSDAGYKPRVGEGICARLWPDVHGGLQFGPSALYFPTPPLFDCPDRRIAAPHLLNAWLLSMGPRMDRAAQDFLPRSAMRRVSSGQRRLAKKNRKSRKAA